MQAWKPIYLVLRPHTLSIYRDQQEEKLRHKIQLADVTAVAFLKDPKQKRQNIFGIFSPSRNWHLEADSKKEAQAWVDILRQEARIEEEEEEMMLASPIGQNAGSYNGFEQAMLSRDAQQPLNDDRLGSSSPEPVEHIPRPIRSNPRDVNSVRRPSHTMDYSGNEVSDFSDVETQPSRVPLQATSTVSIPEEPHAVQPPNPPFIKRNGSDMSGFNVSSPEADPERVVWQGHLLLLKSIRGVRQWKDLWVVIRLKNITLYKNDQEYSPILIISIGSVINAVEIDPLSKSKIHCLQIITEEKSYKFCAKDEEGFVKSLGALKCLVARRKEQDAKRGR